MAKRSAKEKRARLKAAVQRHHLLEAEFEERQRASAAAAARDGDSTGEAVVTVEYVPEPDAADPMGAEHEGSPSAAAGDLDALADGAAAARGEGRPSRAAAGAARATGAGISKRKLRQLRPSTTSLKLRLIRAYGEAGLRMARLVDHQDHAAPNPVVLAQLKATFRSVPVPAHWEQKSSFLSEVKNREPARVVPPGIEATGVRQFIVDPRPDIAKFFAASRRAFFTVHPKDHRKPPAPLAGHGEVFTGRSNERHPATPGELSEELRRALGLSPRDPPPWLMRMQKLGALPPNLPHARFPGLNAPLPPGAQWGTSQGAWGLPVRRANNDYAFPAVVEDAASQPAPPRYWGDTRGIAPPVAESEAVTIDAVVQPGHAARSAVGPPPPPTALYGGKRAPPPPMAGQNTRAGVGGSGGLAPPQSQQPPPGARQPPLASPGVQVFREAGVTGSIYATAKLQPVPSGPQQHGYSQQQQQYHPGSRPAPLPPAPAPKPKPTPKPTSQKF